MSYQLVGTANGNGDVLDADDPKTPLTVADCEIGSDGYECMISDFSSDSLDNADVRDTLRYVSGYVKGIDSKGQSTLSYFQIVLTRKFFFP